MQTDGRKFAKILGDATHDEYKKLKNLLLGLAATHLSSAEWAATIIPTVFCLCKKESKRVLEIAYTAMKEYLLEHFQINIDECVSHWY